MRKEVSYSKLLLVAGVILAAAITIVYFTRASQVPEPALPMRTDIEVMLYTRAGCSYCDKAKNLLEKRRIPYQSVELTNKKDLLIKLLKQTKQTTVPYVFVNGKFVGGYQELAQLDAAGEL